MENQEVLKKWLFTNDYLIILDALNMGNITEKEVFDYLNIDTYMELNLSTMEDKLDELSDKLWILEEEEGIGAIPKVPNEDAEIVIEETFNDNVTFDEIGARKMAVDMYNTTHLKYFLPILTIVMVVLCFGTIFFIMYNTENMRDSLSISVLELCKNILVLIMGFYFGSSIGSKVKDVALGK